MADFNKPITTDAYASVLQEVRDVFSDLARALDPAYTSPTNLPTNAFRWNGASAKFQSYNGTAWNDAAATYNINAATAAKWQTARGLTLSGDVTGSTSFDGSANVAVTANLADAGLKSIAGLTTAADTMIYTTAMDVYATTTLTANARALLDDPDFATMRTTLGLAIGTNVQAYDAELAAIAGLTSAADKLAYFTGSGTAALTDLTANARGLLDDATYADMRATLGVAIGSQVQGYDAGLNSIAGLTTAADTMIYTTASDSYATTTLTSQARQLLDDTDAATMRATLGVTIGTQVQGYDAGLASIAGLTTSADQMIYTTGADAYATTSLTLSARQLLDDGDFSTMRSTLGLAIGSQVQAYDAELAALAGLTSAADKMPYFTGSGSAALADLTSAARTVLDDSTVAAMRSTLGVLEPIGIACSDETTALTTGTKVTFRMPFAYTLTEVRGSLTTAQSSGSIFTVDIHESGTTVLGNKITIDNGEKTSTSAATAPTIADSALADDAEITIDIDQIGDGTAKGLKVWLIGRRSS